MTDRKKIIASAITAFLTLTAADIALAEMDATPPGTEKCYAITKAGMNDCATAKATCSGSATKDNQGDAYLFLPMGTCAKIVGGSLTPK